MSTANERLRQARINAGYESATLAAEALGVTRSTYIGHENGHRGFPASRAPQYARKFKVSEEWLLYGKGDYVPEASVNSEPLLMPVSLPSVDALTEMFAGLLQSIDVNPDEDERAARLARSFPSAFRAASLPQAPQGVEKRNTPAKRSPSGGLNLE